MKMVMTLGSKARGALRLSLFLFWCLGVLNGCSRGPTTEVVVATGKTMGTTYTVKVVAPNNQIPSAQDVKQWADEVLNAVNQSMSTYIPDSELSRLNALDSADPVKVSAPLYDVLALSQHISELTAGAFDITVMPLVDLWGFGPKPNQFQLPSDEQITATLARIGYTKIGLAHGQVSKPQGVSMDLSAVAKGYGADQVAKRLLEKGYGDVMVEVGGELVLRGNSPRGGPWVIGVENPQYNVLSSKSSPAKTVALNNAAMATSGDYRNYYELHGKRYSHTVDPVTGRPITHSTASVTIIADSCAKADALATAMSVMGADKGLELAQRHNIAALFIVKSGAEFETKTSPAFEQYLK